MSEYIDFENWLSSKGTIIQSEPVNIQVGGEPVNQVAGGDINKYSKPTKKPKVSKTDITVKDMTVSSVPLATGIDHDDTFSDENPLKKQIVASRDIEVFTPQINLQDVFKVNYKP